MYGAGLGKLYDHVEINRFVTQPPSKYSFYVDNFDVNSISSQRMTRMTSPLGKTG